MAPKKHAATKTCTPARQYCNHCKALTDHDTKGHIHTKKPKPRPSSNPSEKKDRDKMLCFFCMKSGHLARNCPRKLHAEDTDENGDIIRLEVCWNCGGTGHNGGKCEEVTGRPLNVRRTLTNRSLFRKARDEGLDFADIAMRAPGVEKGASGILGDAPIDDGMECDEATPTAAHAIKISLHDSTGITAEFDDALMTLLLTRADTAESPVVERSKDFVILRFNNEEDAQQATQRLHNPLFAVTKASGAPEDKPEFNIRKVRSLGVSTQGDKFLLGCHAPGAPGKGYLSAPFFQSPLNYLTRPWGGLEGPHRHMECLFVP